jgi:hypothetical protein
MRRVLNFVRSAVRCRLAREPRDTAGMTKEELIVWAAKHGKVVVDKAEHEQLCADTAAAVAETADLDAEYEALCNHHA